MQQVEQIPASPTFAIDAVFFVRSVSRQKFYSSFKSSWNPKSHYILKIFLGGFSAF